MTGKVLNNNSTGLLILIIPVAAGMVLLYKAWPALLILFLLTILWRLWDNYQWKQWCQDLNPFFNQLVKDNQGCLTPMDLSIKTNLTGKAAKRFLDRKAEEYGAVRQDQGESGMVYYFITASALGSIFDDSEPEALPAGETPSLSFELPSETLSSSSSVGEEIEIISEPTKTNSESLSSSPFASLAALKEERQQIVEFSEIDSPVTNPEPKAETEISQEKVSFSEPSEAENTLKVDNPLSQGLIQADLAKRLDLNPSTVGRRKSDPDFPQWSQSKDPDGIAWKYVRKTKMFVPIL